MHNSNRVIIRDENYDNKTLRLNETLFSNANGYIGVRGTLEEGVPADFSTMRGMYLAGVYEIIPMKQSMLQTHSQSICISAESASIWERENSSPIRESSTWTKDILPGRFFGRAHLETR